jgi:protein-tyrosine-phosphatase
MSYWITSRGRPMALWLQFVEWLNSHWPGVEDGLLTTAVLAAIGYSCSVARTYLRRNHKVLVYVSSGGTCRDPMAKAITEQLLKGHKLKYPIDVYAVGTNPLEKSASFAAQQTMKDMYGLDLLKRHRPRRFTKSLSDRANLILMMDRHLFEGNKNTFDLEKTYVLKNFFGLEGDIDDPYQSIGQNDPKTLARYRACAEELKKIISENMDKLLTALGEK